MEIVLGAEVKDKVGRVGKISSFNKNGVYVDCGDTVIEYRPDCLVKGFLIYTDEELQSLLNEFIKRCEEEDRKKEEERLLRLEEMRKRRIEEEDRKKREADLKVKKKQEEKKKNKPHPYIEEKRKKGKSAVFMVCQRKTYDHEINEQYLWAGIDALPSHAELELVNIGDVIFHHFDNKIFAISTVTKGCVNKAAKLGHPECGKIGRFVELNTHKLLNPADTTDLKEYKIKYGSMKYGPFDVNGQNKQSNYLSELADAIANAFMEASISANPNDKELVEIKNKIWNL